MTIARMLAGVLLLLQAAPTYQERDFLTRIRRLTVEGRRAGEGYWSPDGKKLVFQSEREPGNPFYQIYSLDMTTGDTTRISPGYGKTTCSFFRPGFFFSSRRRHTRFDCDWSSCALPICSAIPMAEPGSAVLVFEDQTERRRLQEQLIQSEKMSAIGQLIAGVAHDLNNPLASVVGFSDFL